MVRDGAVVRSRGDIEVPVYFRSAAKPIQALAVVESGAADLYGFTEQELALVCASHSGAPAHAQLAASILQKVGEDAGLLRCGGHKPLDPEVHDAYVRQGYEPGRLEDNCSGKHAGMIGAAKAMDDDVATYAEFAHPLQQQNLANIAELCGVTRGEVGLGVDGCAVPSYAVPVRAMALALEQFTSPDALPAGKAAAARRIADAILRYPDMVAGERRFDTRLMRAGGGRLLSKMGAEGVQVVGILGERMGIAVKIADGGRRAVHALTTALLIDLGLLDAGAAADLYPHQVTTREGVPVGECKVRL